MSFLNISYRIIRGIFITLSAVWHIFIKILITVILLLMILAGLSYGLLHNLYVQSRNTEYKVLSNINEGSFRHMMNTRIYDSSGLMISEIRSADFEYTPISEISPYIQEGYIAVEDRDFKSHPGINLKAMGRAGLSIIKNHGKITQGGSTITQQLVKNTLLTQKQTISRKAVEALLAIDIERKFSKADIMEYYLNSCYYGNGCYGVGSACRYYFGKKPAEVSPAEAAMIVGISNNPNNVNPVASIKNARVKRHTVLKQMKSFNVISESEYKTADKAPLEAKQITPDRTPESYQSTYAVHCAALQLMENDGFPFQYIFKDKDDYKSYQKKYQREYSRKTALIRGGGYRIYTSFKKQDQAKLQKAVDTVLDDTSRKKQKNKKYLLQGAAVSVDNETGYITAIVGGRGTGDQYNRAFLASRQSGSSIKPVIDYGPAFDTGRYFPSLVVKDEKIKNGPKNAGSGYKGSMTIRYAIKDSVNTVAYNILQDIGIKRGLSYLSDLEFTGLSYLDNYSSSIAIGGFTNGVHVTDMARAYAAIADGGEMWERTCITRITDEVNGTVYQESEGAKKRVYSSASAYMLTSCMEDVFDKGGTGHGLLPEGQHCAGKTGTTNGLKDGWFCGYNTDYTCVVWVGNDDSTAVNHNYGATYAGKIWKDYMESKGGGSEKFSRPDTVVLKYTGAGGYPADRHTDKKDLFAADKKDTVSKEKTDWELENTKKRAESAVSALEKLDADSLGSYLTGYRSALRKAQDAVAAIPDAKERSPYLERINTKVEALQSESEGWDDVQSSEAEYREQAEKDRQQEIKKKQAEANARDKIRSEVARFEDYISMVNGLKAYSRTQERLLEKAYDAWQKISDESARNRVLPEYTKAAEYVNSLKTDAENKSGNGSYNDYDYDQE